jgi:hypothetical protein
MTKDLPLEEALGALAALALLLALFLPAAASAEPTRSPLDPANSKASGKPLAGKSYEYAWDGRDIGHPERAWLGRAYVPPKTATSDASVPLVVFLHGLNAALIKYRWMGGGREGDVRRIIGDLVDSGTLPPVVVAGPSSIIASQVSKGASWNHFDLDRFIDKTISRLSGMVAIDEKRIIVAGHSGAGCSGAGGLATVGESKRRLLAIVSIDTCMAPSLAEILARAPSRTHVVVGYQTSSWGSRPFSLFRKAFEREVKKQPPNDGVLRVVERQRPKRAPHDATVKLTLERYLPKILPSVGQPDT